IFFNEALCVLSALEWASAFLPPRSRLAIFTDSQNSVDIYGSLKADPDYNLILLRACELAICADISLRVWHIPGVKNTVADALSRQKLDLARSLVPGLRISSFSPPPINRPKVDAQIERSKRRHAGPSTTRP
ncbi:hypothetical protein AURDEDRAFT_63101, partial [Auricularia subglabra TFB-10046 SS5]